MTDIVPSVGQDTGQPPAYSGPKRILSGIQASGSLHLGNYLGALKRFVEM